MGSEPAAAQQQETAGAPRSSLPALALAALGVVYGDIGTSPLYTLKEVFASTHHPLPLTPGNVLGILSLILWSLIIVVSVKYVGFVMRADNRGEGGIMALIALALGDAQGRPRREKFVIVIGMLGAAMFYGDGMITPAISVLSAVEGLEVATPAFTRCVVPITVAVLFALFAAQHHGTGRMGVLFRPVMTVWFLTLALLGLVNILHHPGVLAAVNPAHALWFFMENRGLAFVILGAVVLAVTGSETLYADMGHFGRRPIRLAWFGFVLPALELNYFGQGALVLEQPGAVTSPFYHMAPDWALYPLLALATLATVIASQAVISGAFSVTRQAMQLGFVPRMAVQHTSEREKGQIYLPFVNWGLFALVLALVLGFRSSGNLAAAYDRASMLWDMLLEAGKDFGIEVGGYKVLDALRLEKGYRYYTVDVTQLETPFEGGLGFCVDLNKKDFIGKAALARQKAEGIKRKLCTLVVYGDEFTQLYGGEAIYHQGKMLTRVRSGGSRGYTVKKNILYAYLPLDLGKIGTRFEAKLIEGRRMVEVTATVLFDPKGERCAPEMARTRSLRVRSQHDPGHRSAR